MIRSTPTVATLLALSATLGAGAAHADPTRYQVQVIQAPADPNFTEAFGINDAGTIVGTHGATVNQGFTRTPSGTVADMNFPAAAQTQVTGISGRGLTSGIFVDQGGTTHGFVGAPAGMGTSFQVRDQPGTAFNQLLGISANGNNLAGYSSLDPAGQTLQKAYSTSVNSLSYTDINGLLPANLNSQATGINDSGATVGFFMPTTTTSLGFLDLAGSITPIDPFGSTFTQALGIANSGEIVGLYTDANGVQHGYTDNGGMFASFDPANSLSTTINGVNDRGQLVGFFTNAATDQVLGFEATPASATPVSEPASMAILAIGLVGSTVALRRRPA